MKICESRGHKYYPTVRRVTTSYVFGSPVTTEENVLYCARCADVKSLDTRTPYYKTTDFGTFTWSTGTNTSSGWLYLSNTDPSGDPL